jgi:hypothetical protein
MRKPEFEQFRQSLLRRAKPLPQRDREPYRKAIVDLLEESGVVLVQRARKDGHDDALTEFHATWIGPDFSPDYVISTLKSLWPGAVFPTGEQKYWIEVEEEIVDLLFAWDNGDGQFLTGKTRITLG